MTEPVFGLVLAGGRATRMGGGDKPLRLLAGRPLLDHVLQRMAPQCAGLLINANGDPERFARYRLPVVADASESFDGPLAGILAGLDHVAATRPDITALVSVAGDSPFLPTDLVRRLQSAAREQDRPFACAGSGGWTHPVIGLWPLTCRQALREALAAGERKIDRFTGRFGCATAEWPATPADPFFNINTPEDLAEAARLLEQTGLSPLA